MKVNPLGNISGNNDFIYTDYLVHARISVDIPLSFAADQLALADTAPFSVGNTNNFDPVGAGTFSLIADNGFPFDASLKLLVLDENNMLLDSIFVPGVIAAADVDASYHVIAPKRTRIPMYVDETKKQRILQGKNLSILANFTTPAFPQYYRFYSGYKLDLKLVGDAAYLIH